MSVRFSNERANGYAQVYGAIIFADFIVKFIFIVAKGYFIVKLPMPIRNLIKI